MLISWAILISLQKLNREAYSAMHKLDHEDSVPTVSGNVCAVLVLPCPFLELSAIDWYWRKICGVPLLVRNIINLQRAGLDSLFIYDDVDGAELYKRLCEEKGYPLS